jgi:hypothetical protein
VSTIRAWIGVVSVTVGGVVTVAGSMVNGLMTHRVAETTIEGEHRQRLWEKQSAAYEDTVRELLARRARREALTSRGDVGNIGSHLIEEMRKAKEPESIQIRAALWAYASLGPFSRPPCARGPWQPRWEPPGEQLRATRTSADKRLAVMPAGGPIRATLNAGQV